MIRVTHGSCINLKMGFKDDKGQLKDIFDDTFAVIPVYPAVFANAVLKKVSRTHLHFHLAAEHSAMLNLGGANRFRLSRIAEDGCVHNSDIITVVTR